MKKISLLLLSVLFIVGCKNDTKNTPETESAVSTKTPIVYVSTYPLHYFAKRIGGEHIDLRFPMKTSKSITNWKPKTITIASMQESDFVFINGAGFEKWLMSTSISESIVINTTKNLEDRLLESGSLFTHSHGDDGAHVHNELAALTWLDMDLANKQAEVIANHLISKFPEHKAVYESNFKTLSEELIELDTKFKTLTATNLELQVIFSLPVYQYFEKAYNLKGRSLHWEPNYELNHDRAQDIEYLKKAENFKYMIWEAAPLSETKSRLEAMGIESIVVNPIYTAPENSNYFKEMEANYNQLSKIYKVTE
ncbi:adhesion lipoprotein [Formosa agariphila KMM 3901]|uniref:Adhesion lipoprotein n=1 Tax=Formosa agariphila (strain DSM 15362 / KCTC 12365 / LMG 23005 / KMM 3901 / M-2Alg 35-1) TaxID=1347342 RepID=T2KM15_FORAG|nr:metal ABC transporter substrate-binding protein [Formosa agariphila]CDF79770.1 adhesion lipoprotein [Formosa agariphila KMM 3901]